MSHPERIVPDEVEPGIVASHLKRYEFAVPFCEGRRVLDAGCGVGYGSARVAERAALVLGIDADDQAVEYARRRYTRANLDFAVMDLHDLRLADESFDTVCCFETIEHADRPERALAELARVLRPSGTLLVSTPNARETTSTPQNPHHRIEWSAADFECFLRRYFSDVRLYGQRRRQTRRHRLLQRLDVLGLRRHAGFLAPLGRRVTGTPATAEVRLDDVVISEDRIEQANELVAVCRRS